MSGNWTSAVIRSLSRLPPASPPSAALTLLYSVLPVAADDLAVDEAHIGLVMVAFTAPARLGALLLVASLEALFFVMGAMSVAGTLALVGVTVMRDPERSSW